MFKNAPHNDFKLYKKFRMLGMLSYIQIGPYYIKNAPAISRLLKTYHCFNIILVPNYTYLCIRFSMHYKYYYRIIFCKLGELL